MPRRSIPFWIILILYWGFAFYMTHLPGLVIHMPGGDKTAHYLAFGLLGGLLYLALWTNNPSTRDLAFKILVIGLCYAALDEWTQALPFFHRDCDFLDWCADSAGIATAIVGMTLLHRTFDLIAFRPGSSANSGSSASPAPSTAAPPLPSPASSSLPPRH